MGGGWDVAGMAAAELGSNQHRLAEALALSDFGNITVELAPWSQSPCAGARGHLARATRDPVEIARRFHAHPDNNYGIVPHGPHFIVDDDGGELPWTIGPTPTVLTGSVTDGHPHRHIYLTLPAAWRGWSVRSKQGATIGFKGVDIIGSAGGAPPYAVGPGSRRTSGPYAWAAGLSFSQDQVPVAEAPPELVQWLQDHHLLVDPATAAALAHAEADRQSLPDRRARRPAGDGGQKVGAKFPAVTPTATARIPEGERMVTVRSLLGSMWNDPNVTQAQLQAEAQRLWQHCERGRKKPYTLAHALEAAAFVSSHPKKKPGRRPPTPEVARDLAAMVTYATDTDWRELARRFGDCRTPQGVGRLAATLRQVYLALVGLATERRSLLVPVSIRELSERSGVSERALGGKAAVTKKGWRQSRVLWVLRAAGLLDRPETWTARTVFGYQAEGGDPRGYSNAYRLLPVPKVCRDAPVNRPPTQNKQISEAPIPVTSYQAGRGGRPDCGISAHFARSRVLWRSGGLGRTGRICYELLFRQDWRTVGELATAAHISRTSCNRALLALLQVGLAKRVGSRGWSVGRADPAKVETRRQFDPQRLAAENQKQRHQAERQDPRWLERLAELTGRQRPPTKLVAIPAGMATRAQPPARLPESKTPTREEGVSMRPPPATRDDGIVSGADLAAAVIRNWHQGRQVHAHAAKWVGRRQRAPGPAPPTAPGRAGRENSGRDGS